MKKSKLLALSLASLVGLAGCGSSTPSSLNAAKALTEKFVEVAAKTLGFDTPVVSEVSEADIEAGEYGVDVFSDFFFYDMYSNFGVYDVPGYEYYDYFFIPKEAAASYSHEAVFYALFGSDELRSRSRDAEEPGEEPGEVDPVDPEPAEPAPIDEFLEFVDGLGGKTYDIYGTYCGDSAEGENYAYTWFEFCEYGSKESLIRETFFAFGLEDRSVSKEDYIGGLVEGEGLSEEEALAEYNAMAELYATDEKGALYYLYFTVGAFVFSEYGEKYSPEELCDYVALEAELAGDVFVESGWDAYYEEWAISGVAGLAPAENPESEAVLKAAAKYVEPYLPEDVVFDEEESWYGDPTASDYIQIFRDDPELYYYCACYVAEDGSIQLAIVAYVYEYEDVSYLTFQSLMISGPMAVGEMLY